MWEPFLWWALVVAVWRWLTRRRSGVNTFGPLPDVGDAPADAEPIIRPRLDDNGLATFSMVVPAAADGHAANGPRSRGAGTPAP